MESDSEKSDLNRIDEENDCVSTKKIVIYPDIPTPSSLNKKKSNYLLKRLKLKSKSFAGARISPNASSGNASSLDEPRTLERPDERKTPEGEDTMVALMKSSSETDLQEQQVETTESLRSLTAAKPKQKIKKSITMESGHILPHTCSQPIERVKSLENLKDLPTYGDIIAGVRLSNTNQIIKPRDHLYKILVIGDLGTGKTSIIKRYVHRFFTQHYRATIGVDFALKVLNWDENTLIRLQLWDIAGQERYGNMTRVYYKEAVGAFIVFDVTRRNTFESVANWKSDLDYKVQLPDGSPIPCVLLANKCDQPKEGPVTNETKMDEYCQENNFTAWFETSARDDINIDEAAKALVQKILAYDTLLNDKKSPDEFSLKDSNDELNRKKSCAC